MKRALERSLVQPLSNLMATDQIHGGDLLRVDFDTATSTLRFVKEAEGMSTHAMAQVAEQSLAQLASAIGTSASYELAKATTSGRSTRR